LKTFCASNRTCQVRPPPAPKVRWIDRLVKVSGRQRTLLQITKQLLHGNRMRRNLAPIAGADNNKNAGEEQPGYT
jgi:hypothetical protein